jgi:seryl-tRNA synthetase
MIAISKLIEDKDIRDWYISTRFDNDRTTLNAVVVKYKQLQSLKIDKEKLLKERNDPIHSTNRSTEDSRRIKDVLKMLTLRERELEAALQNDWLKLPNIIDKSVYSFEDVVVSSWGESQSTKGATHHDIVDMSEAVKLARNKFPILKGDLALLHRALGQYMLDINIMAGYKEHYLPYLCSKDSLTSTGQLPGFESDLFQVDDLYLIPTGEVPLANLYRNISIEPEEMPIKLTTLTPCFRKEAGSYGKAAQGLKRQHQFDKVEIVEIVEADSSLAALENMVEHVTGILKSLNIPHRVVMLGHKELGFSASKTYDIEVWLPRSQEYMEISSCSLCGDFQARRMKCKLKTYNKKLYVHTLNGSSLAVGRCVIAMLENHLEDGRIKVPSPLIPYCLGKEWLIIA